MKKNDYLIASINNPDFNAEDFKNVAGYSLKDTQMLKEEDYLKSDFIKSNPLFLDSTGMFNRELFSTYYKEKLKDFGDFSNEDFADVYLYSAFDTRRKGKDPVSPFGLTFFNNPNPTMLTMGIEGPNVLGARTLSDREIAQKLKIFDTSTGKFLDTTPNDYAFFKNPFKWAKSLIDDPLVLAIYDEAGTHQDPITGKQVKHNKGQHKLNNLGLPYYERLNGRSLVGRDILAATDILTVDGSVINKYDFLDSDDLDKSIGGVIMKTAAAIAPLFTPAAPYYGFTLMVRELAKTAPMLYAMGTALFNDKEDHPISNTIAAYANKVTTSTSDYAREHTFSLENFGNLIADVALQWEQLMAVVRSFLKLNNATNKRIEVARIKALAEYEDQATKTINAAKLGSISLGRAKELTGASNAKELKDLIASNKWQNTLYGRTAQEKHIKAIEDYIANRTRLGQDMSLAYMALISNTDVYSSALEHGASKKEAAALALGSTAGMFSVDKFLGLGEMFFLVAPERLVFRNSLKHEVLEATKRLIGGKGELPDIGGFFKAGVTGAKKAVRDIRDAVKSRELPILGKAIGEGLEEVSEELVTDLVKSAGELAADFGWISGPTNLGAWDNLGDRYIMSLLGGTIGGGIFGAKLKFSGVENQSGPKAIDLLVRLGRTAELRKELEKMHKKGQLGRTDLSIVYEEDNEGNKVFLTPDEKNISQNDFMYNTISLSIDLILSIIEGDRLGKTENDLFEQLVLKDERYLKLKSFLLDKSYLTGYLERYLKLVESIIDNERKIRNLKDSDKVLDKSAVETAKNAKNEKLLERDRFLSGELSLDYMRKLNFIMNPTISKGFINLSLEDFARAVTGTEYSTLDRVLQWEIFSRHQNYIASRKDVKNDIDKAYNSYKDLTSKLGQPIVNYIELYTPSYLAWDENIKMLEDTKKAAAWSWDQKLPGESDEDFNSRNKIIDGESPEDFINRQIIRLDAITKHNESVINYLRNALNNGVLIDETNKRRLSVLLLNTELQIKKLLLELNGVKDPELGKEILDGTPPEEVLPKLRKKKELEIRNKVWNTLVSLDFSMVEVPMDLDPETGEITSYDRIPTEIALNGEDYSDELKVMLVVQLRMMDQLGITKYTTSNLYNALGTNPLEVLAKFYEIYNGILADIILEDLEKGMYPALTYTGLVRATNHPIADLLLKYGESLDAITATDPEERKAAISEVEQNFSLADIREQAISELVAHELDEWESKGIVQLAGNITRALDDNLDIKLLLDLRNHSTLLSPGQSLLEIVSKLIGGDVDINSLLKELGQRFDSLKEKDEFEITDIEKLNLNKAKELVEIAKSIIASMYKESYLGDSMSYNKAINEFVKAHKETLENWEELPVIDKNIGLSIYHSLDLFTSEIDEWIALSNKNTDNKIKNIKEAAYAYNSVKHNVLFETLKGHTVLKDFEGNNDTAAEVTVFYNALKQIQDGKSIDTLLDEYLALLEKDDAVLSQITSEINQGLADSTFTAYDRFMYMVAISAINKAEYLKAERSFFLNHPDVAYLPTLEPALLYAYALKTNPEFIYKALDKIRILASKKGLDMPPIYGLIVTGIGGAGKTTATAAFFAEGEEDIWLSGPDNEQITGLKSIAPNGEGKIRKDLIDYILGGNRDLLKKTTTKKGLDNSKTLILSDISDKLITKDAPKLLIIDEATHYSNLELLALSLWAKKGGTHILFIGDENQMGNSILEGKSYVNNFGREVSIGFRAPRQAISLRTSNKWKTDNQNEVVFLMNTLRNSEDSESTKKAVREVLSYIENEFKLKYWEDNNDLHGDRIVKSLSEIDLTKFADKKVAYVGKDNSSLSGKIANIKYFNDITKVQGKEFDYVICDNILLKFDINQAPTLLEGLRTFYTAISRSRIGGIIIDGENAYDFIHLQKQSYTTQSVNLSEDIIKEMNADRFSYIEKALSEIPSFKIDEPIIEEPKKEKPKKIIKQLDISKAENPIPEYNGEYRAYSNINFLGGVTKEDVTIHTEVFGPGKFTKWHASGTRKDIGIFSDSGLLASSPNEKASLVYDLACLRSIFTFNKLSLDKGNDYLDVAEFNNLPLRIQDLFDLDSFEKVKYYAVAEDYDDTTHSLIGLTNAESDLVSFMKGKDGNKKVISILARIPGKHGIEYTITLGAVANPDTWEKSLANRIIPEDPIEAKAVLDDIDNLKKAIALYRQELEDLVNIDKEAEIDKPTFSGQTEIIPLGEKIALADIEGGISEWEKMTVNFSISPVYVIVEDLKEINPELSDLLKGKPVIFVSSDPTLDKNRLRDMWKNQLLHRDTNVPKVRMLVLNNRGISFNSLYAHTFDDIYRTSFRNSLGLDVYFTVPVETEPEAVRIFVNTWNYRANLLNFDAKVKEFMDNEGWDLETLEAKVKRYNELYILAKEEVNNDKSEFNTLSDPLFLKWLLEHPDVDGVEDTLKIREFNHGLDTREFRLGYSKDGAYISKILGEGVKLYPKDSEPYGIYITPKLYQQYIKVLDSYFNNIVNPIFKDTVAALSVKEEDKETSLVNKNIELAEENWYDTLQSSRTVALGIEGVGVKTVPMPIADDLNSFTFAVINVPTLLRRKAIKGKSQFMSEYNRPPKEGKDPLHRIKIKVNGTELYANYTEIDDAFEFNGTKGILSFSDKPRKGLTGEIAFDWKRDDEMVETMYIDTRLDTFFSLMFHGIVALRVNNDFEESKQPAATDADFRHGIFIDATLASFEGDRKAGNITGLQGNFAALTNTNNALFLTDSVPGGPLLSFSFKKSSSNLKEDSEKIIKLEESNPLAELINKINTIAGQKILNPDKTYTERKIENKLNLLNNELFGSVDRFDLNNILFNLGKESLLDRYIDKYTDLNNIISKEKKAEYILLTTPTAMYTVKLNGKEFLIDLYTVSDETELESNKQKGTVQSKSDIKNLTMGKLRTFITNYFTKEDPDDLEVIKNYMSRWPVRKVITADYNQKDAVAKLEDNFLDRRNEVGENRDKLFITFEQALNAFFNCK